MRFGVVLVGGLGALLGLAATWFAAGSGAVVPRLIALASFACLVGLVGLWLAADCRPRLGALLLIEAPLGLGVALGEQAIIPGVLLVSAAALAALGRPPAARPLRGSRPRSPLRIG